MTQNRLAKRNEIRNDLDKIEKCDENNGLHFITVNAKRFTSNMIWLQKKDTINAI